MKRDDDQGRLSVKKIAAVHGFAVMIFIVVGTASWAQSGFLSGGWLHDDWPAEQKFTPNVKAVLSFSGEVKNMDAMELNRASTYEGFVLGAARLMIDL